VDIGSTLVALPEVFLDASDLLPTSCAAQGERPSSSLGIGGAGGLPPDPAARLPAPATTLGSGAAPLPELRSGTFRLSGCGG
jgi:large exoprotein involved in heme utilization and adhesion